MTVREQDRGAPSAAVILRQSGRMPSTPYPLRLDDGSTLTIHTWLRILPAKRLSGIAEWRGKTVLAKLFIAETGAGRHWQRECDGSSLLAAHDIPTPGLLASGTFDAGGHYVLYEFLAAARRLDAHDPEELEMAFALLGRMHSEGIVQGDAHFGNFLFDDQRLYVIDGDAISSASSVQDRLANLALLFAQLPSATVARNRMRLLDTYRRGNPESHVDADQVDQTISAARQTRMTRYLDKCLRDCSQFKVTRTASRFVALIRAEEGYLIPLLADPDKWIAQGDRLKSGHTATVALVEHAGRKVVIKRYNIKGVGHALSRFWRPSRAWHSWREGHRLQFLGIPTPKPLALIEQRCGPLRGKAWLITEYCAGDNLGDKLASTPADEDLACMRGLFAQMIEARISHGDLKAKNLLWHDGGPCLIDLDAMCQHQSAAGFRRAWKKDRVRFLRNWPADSPLQRALETTIPAG